MGFRVWGLGFRVLESASDKVPTRVGRRWSSEFGAALGVGVFRAALWRPKEPRTRTPKPVGLGFGV